MSDLVWEIEHSVETEASLEFAWTYLTNVANWDDPPAEFELDGPFAAGSCGTTRLPGQELRHWRIREVRPMESYTIETLLDGAAMSFEWRFDGLADGRTRLTQNIALTGECAANYREQVESAFTASLADGMKRIAEAMGRAQAGGGAGRRESGP